MRKNERKNKIKRIVDSSEIDWAGIMRCNISDRSMLCNKLDEELTDSQIDSLLYETSSPLKITGVTLLCSDDETSHDIESNNIVITDRGGRPLLTIEMNWQFFD